MDLIIKAESAEDLRHQICTLAHQYDNGSAKVYHAKGKNTTTAPIQTAAEETNGSIFGVDADAEATPATVAKVTKGKKAAAAPEAEIEEPSYTREQVADKLRMVITKCGGNGARALMSRLQYDHVGKIPESDFGSFIAACDKEIEKAVAAKKK